MKKHYLKFFSWLFLLTFVLFGYSQTEVIAPTSTSGAFDNGNPIYRSSTTSTFDHSRSVLLYTAADLANAGIPANATITSIALHKANDGTLAGSNTATFNVFLNNSNNSVLTTGTWNDRVTNAGAELVYSNLENSSTIPSVSGWWELPLSTPFLYTGGALEVATAWAITAPATNPRTTNTFLWSFTSRTGVGAIGTSNSTALTGSSSLSSTQSRSYALRITYLPPSDCTGAPSVGTPSVALINFNCPGGSFTASYSGASIGGGLTNQWQFSSDGVNWSDIPGATSTVLASNASSSGFVRRVITCSFSGLSDEGDPIELVVPDPISSLPWQDSFETYGFTTSTTILANDWGCYTRQTVTGSAWSGYSGVLRSQSARTGSAYLIGRWSSSNAWVFTPAIELQAGQSYDYSFWYKHSDVTSPGMSFNVAVGQGSNQASMSTSLGSVVDYNSQTWVEFRATFVAPTTGMYFFGVQNATSSGAPWYLMIDDMMVENTPSCPAPQNLLASGITNNAALLSWTDPGQTPAAEYEIEYGVQGFTQGTGTIDLVTTNSLSLTGLSSNTPYSFYVRALCGSSQSMWSGPVNFRTLCDAFDLPISQNFDAETANLFAAPECWFRIASGVGTAGTTTSGSPLSSAPNQFQLSNSSDASGNYMLISPAVNGLASALVSFSSRSTTAGTQLQVGYMTDPADASTFVLSETVTLTTTNTIYEVNLPSAAIGHLAFRHGLTATFSTLYIDDIFVETPPTCPRPSNVAFTQQSLTSAEITWQENGSATLWNFEYGLEGFTQGTGTVITGLISPSILLSGLATNQNYQFYVQADCGDGDLSLWSNALTFQVGYCVPTYTSGISLGDLISRVRVLGTTLDNNSGVAEEGPSYTYFEGQPNLTAELRQGTTYQLGVSIGSFGSGQFMTAWIDFNNDGVFDESERLGFTAQGTTTAFQEVLFPIALPSDAPLGTFRMRVRSVWNATTGANITPCGSFGFGEAEDYDITVIEPITTVVDPTDCNTTINQVAYEYFNAVPVQDAQEYEFRIQSGSFTATATSATGASRFFDFAGFQYGTTYDVSVRVKINEAYGPFGASCPISIDAAPVTSVQSPACGSTLASIATPINAFGVPNAQMYRFEVTNTSDNSIQLLERTTRNMTLPMLPNFAFGTTYSIRVQVMLNDAWLPFDAVCELTSPTATTQLRPVSCNVTIPNPASLIYAQSVVSATSYQFEVTNTSTSAVEVITSSVPNFRLNQLSAVQLGVDYSIRVRAEVNGNYGAYGTACNVFITSPALALRPISCNTTLPAFASAIHTETMPGASQYRFEFTNTTTNAVEEVDSPLGVSFVRLTDLATPAAFGTVYNVRVRAIIDGIPATAYGAVCTVTAPSPTTQLRTQDCNVLLSNPATPLNANKVSGATEYQFEVTNTSTNQVDVITRSVRSMTLLMMPNMMVEEGTTYSIRVRVLLNGQYTQYGTACTVTTPGDVPLTQLDETSCNGFFFPWDPITAEPVANATAYRFSITDGSQSEVVEMTENFMSGFDMVTLPFFGSYAVQVAAQVQGVWGEYGEICQITFLEEEVTRTINNPTGLAVIGYPNPFNDGFMLRISSKTEVDLVVSVYDMTGKLIEVTKYNSQATQTTFGRNLPSGVYNVNVVGGNINETVKLVKN